MVLVAAAGNGGNQTKIYPGAYPNVIAVAATDNKDAKASFSTYGASWVDVAAPGPTSTPPSRTTRSTSAPKTAAPRATTSATAPQCPRPSSPQLPPLPGAHIPRLPVCPRKVEKTADKIAGTGTYWKYGRVNAYNAVR